MALRGPVSGSTPLAGGFTIVNSADKKLLLRAVGPTLGAGGLADPVLKVYDRDGTTLVDSNDNWGGGASLANAFLQAGAFSLAGDSKDAAILGATRIGTGSYTAQVTSANGSGEALWEVYDLNGNAPATSAPIIVAAPVSQSVTGGNVTFRTLASGGGTLTYKWKKGDDVITSASTSSLTINSVSAADAATYTVEVTNAAGTASASASLHHIPSIASVTGPTAGHYKAGTTLGFTVAFNGSITVTGTPRLALTIGSAIAYATYDSAASTATSLKFNYTVAAGDTDVDGIACASAIDLNGGSIKDSASNDVGLTFTAPTLTGVFVDTTAPTVALASTVTGSTKLASIPLTITFSEDVTGFTLADLAVQGATAGNLTGSGKSYAVALTPSGDGTITVNLAANRAEDIAGNGNTGATPFSIVSDRTPPASPTIAAIDEDTGISSNDLITRDNRLVFSGTAEPGATIELRWPAGNPTLGVGTTDSSGKWTVDYTAVTLGNYSIPIPFIATATDAAGNKSLDSERFQIRVDTLAPTVSLSSSATGPTRSAPIPLTITFSESVHGFSLDDLIVSGGTAGNLTGSGATYSVAITTTGDGTVTVNLPAAKAQDTAGNDNTAATQFSIVYDGTAPAAPMIASISADTGTANDGVTSDNTLVIAGTAEAASTVEIFRGGNSIGTTTANGSGAWTFDHSGTALPDDDYSFTAKARDAAGNVSAASAEFVVTVDTLAPASPVIAAISDDTGASATDLITSDTTLVLSGTSESGATVTITRVGSGVLGSVKATKSGAWSYDYTGTVLAAGEHSFTAIATDLAGNASSASAAFIVTIDTTTAAPTIASISSDTGKSGTDGITHDNTLTLTGTAEAGSTVTLTRSGATAALGTATANGSGAWTFGYSAVALADGSYIFSASATDTAGNASATSADFPVVIDTTAPTAPAIASIATDSGSSASDRVTNDPTLTLAGTAEAGSQVELFHGSTSLGTFAADATSGAWNFDHTATTLPEGTHTFTAKATDAAGNTSVSSADFVVTVDLTAPSISSAATAGGSYKSAFTFTVIAAGATQFAASSLPAGLTIDAATGVISGTPTESGSFSAAITVTDAAGNSATGTLAITIAKVNLTVVGVVAVNKTYDNTTAAVLNFAGATLVGVMSGDTVTLDTSAAVGAFADRNAGNAIAVTITGLTLSGTHASHYTVTQPSASASIAPSPVVISIGNLNHVYDGTAKRPTVSVVPNVSHVVNFAEAVNAGSYMVNVNVTDPNHSGSQTATLTIAKVAQTITLSAPGTATLGVAAGVSATASSGLPVTLAVSGPATLAGTQLTFSAPGTATITATQAGNENYAPATATATVTAVGKLTQTIAFGSPGDRLSNSGSFTINATASSGLPVTFAILGGPAMLSGNTVTLTGAVGQVLIRASQPGDATYEPAPDVNASFTVTAATLNVFFGTVTRAGDAAKTGDVAATLPPNSNQGSLLVVAPGVNVNTVVDFTLNPDGTFTQTVVVDVPATSSADPNTPARAAAPVTLTITGTLVNGRLQGTIHPLGLAFNANVLPVAGPSANAAGLYKSSTLANTNGSTFSIVGTNNEVLVLAQTPAVTTGGLTSLQPDGTFGLQTATALGTATIRGTVDEPTTTVAGTISLPGRPETSFAGLVVTTTRTDRLVNLSSRVRIGGGDRVLITGFVIGGEEPKQVLVRGIGPALAAFGVQGALANPRIQIFRGGQMVAENDNWAGATALASAFARVGAFGLTATSSDAALLVTLPPGAYTAQVLDGGASGVALAEIYDASVNPNSEYQRLVNISTRGEAGTGENVLIGGFIVTGNAPKKLLVRGIGPGLAAFGVGGTLADPRLQVFRDGVVLAENDNWSAGAADETAAVADAARATGAFNLAAGSRDAALILTLAPGQYTAQVSPSGTTAAGVALVEIYEIPE